jgi:putative permease
MRLKRIKKPLDPAAKQDLLKLMCFILAVLGSVVLFLGTPSLSTPTLISMVLVALFSPWVMALERAGFARNTAITLLLSTALVAAVGLGAFAFQRGQIEWGSFQERAPEYFSTSVEKISSWEARIKSGRPYLSQLHLASSISTWGEKSAAWFADKLPLLLSQVLSSLFLVPILTFLFLSQGRKIKRRFFQLVPNRAFESVFIMTHGVTRALSDFLRARLVESFIMSIIISAGLGLVHAPYAIVIGIWAGIVNVIPYLGPVMGAAPALIIATFDPLHPNEMFWGCAVVFLIANLIDNFVIFPGIVAKLVKLNPLILVASVMIGQNYYGVVGMLISIPVAAAIKVILGEVYVSIYGARVER